MKNELSISKFVLVQCGDIKDDISSSSLFFYNGHLGSGFCKENIIGYGFEMSYYLPLLLYIIKNVGKHVLYIGPEKYTSERNFIKDILTSFEISMDEDIVMKSYNNNNAIELYSSLSVLLNIYDDITTIFINGNKTEILPVLLILNTITVNLFNHDFEEAAKHYRVITYDKDIVKAIKRINPEYVKNVYVIDYFSDKESTMSENSKEIIKDIKAYTGVTDNDLIGSKLLTLYSVCKKICSEFVNYVENDDTEFSSLVNIFVGKEIDWIYNKAIIEKSNILSTAIFLSSLDENVPDILISTNPPSNPYVNSLSNTNYKICDITKDEETNYDVYMLGLIMDDSSIDDMIIYSGMFLITRYLDELMLIDNKIFRAKPLFASENTLESKIRNSLYEDKIDIYIGGWKYLFFIKHIILYYLLKILE